VDRGALYPPRDDPKPSLERPDELTFERFDMLSGGRGTDREFRDDGADILELENEGALWFIAIWLSPLDCPALWNPCGGRGTERPAVPGVARFCGSDPRADAVSGPRAEGVPSLRPGEVPVFRAVWFPKEELVRAGGVMWLTVGREKADADGLAAVSPARDPAIAWRPGAASTLLSADAPLSCPAETLTEFPRTGIPRSRLFRDIAVVAVAA